MTAEPMTAARPRRHGILTPPKVDALDVAALAADIKAREVVPLPELGAKIGMSQQARKHAIREGLIEPVPELGPHRAKQITAADALMLVAAAALALAAGVAIATMLRGLKGAGVTPGAAAAVLEGMTG